MLTPNKKQRFTVLSLTAGLLMGLLGAGGAYAGSVTTDGEDLIVNTKGGLEVKTANGDYGFKLGGRIQLDGNVFEGVTNTAEDNTGSDIFFRRARLEVKGYAKDWSYLVSYNMTGGGSIDQLHASYNGWGSHAKLTLGQQKEDFGLDDTGSSKWIVGIERAPVTNAFDTGINLGVKLHGANDQFTYSLGMYKESIDAETNNLDIGVTGRAVWRPIYDNGDVLHLGLGVTQREGSFDAIDARLGLRGGADGNANKVEAEYNAGVANRLTAYNLEAAAIFGPWLVMAEYFSGEAKGVDTAPDLEGEGYYLQLGWMVTGETRAYKTGSAVVDKIKPKNKGGAWELLVRYDALDLGDSADAAVDLTGGEGTTLTLGANWYINSHVKLALNLIHAETDIPIGGVDDGDAFAARLQYLF